MANYILVHGGKISADTWNKLSKRNDYPAGKLLGGEIWKKIISKLEEQGHRVFAPTLKDEYNNGLSDHIDQICNLIARHDLEKVILVGHSYGGMVITGVADKIADKIELLIYIDAALPDPGQSLFDILSSGEFNPQTVVGGSPKAYTEKLDFDPKHIKPLPKIFIFCTASEFKPVTDITRKKIAANSEEWTCIDLPTSHIPQCTMPDELVQLLLDAE